MPVGENYFALDSDDRKLPADSDSGDMVFCQEVNTNNNKVVENVTNVIQEKAIAIPLPTLPIVPTTVATAAACKPPPSSSGGADANFRADHESWNDMLYQLLLYKARKGDVNVPNNDIRYRQLYNWIQTQREHYALYQQDETSSSLLNSDRVAVLESIDVQFTVRGEMIWQKNFDALVAYKNEHGDVRVPRQYEKAPKLSEWVTEQRRQCKARLEGKSSAMTAERMAKLDQLGFVWQFRDRMDWNERYEKLLEYKKENGHCIVPQNYMKSNALGKWVAKQREQYCYYQEGKHSFLTEERIDLLNAIGFVWRLKGKGVNKRVANENPMLMPKVQSAVQRKLVAKMKEEEKKMVELQSATSNESPEDTNNSKPPALPTTRGLVGIGFGQLASGSTGGARGEDGKPSSNQSRFLQSITDGAGHGSWLC